MYTQVCVGFFTVFHTGDIYTKQIKDKVTWSHKMRKASVFW